MKLNQAFWPSIADALDTHGQPIGANMDTTKALSNLRFWQEAYLAALCGNTPSYAVDAAHSAVGHLHEYTHRPEESQVPSKPSDELQPAASLREQEDAPSEKQRKLLELADLIDHEELWRWAGMDHHKMTPEQKDRMNAGVALRRYADLWAPGHWIVFPPVGPVHFSASTLEKAVEMAKKDAQRLGCEPGETNV